MVNKWNNEFLKTSYYKMSKIAFICSKSKILKYILKLNYLNILLKGSTALENFDWSHMYWGVSDKSNFWLKNLKAEVLEHFRNSKMPRSEYSHLQQCKQSTKLFKEKKCARRRIIYCFSLSLASELRRPFILIALINDHVRVRLINVLKFSGSDFKADSLQFVPLLTQNRRPWTMVQRGLSY